MAPASTQLLLLSLTALFLTLYTIPSHQQILSALLPQKASACAQHPVHCLGPHDMQVSSSKQRDCSVPVVILSIHRQQVLRRYSAASWLTLLPSGPHDGLYP